jgi:hypothetical protein
MEICHANLNQHTSNISITFRKLILRHILARKMQKDESQEKVRFVATAHLDTVIVKRAPNPQANKANTPRGVSSASW